MKQGFSSIFEEMEKAIPVRGYECSIKTFLDTLSPNEKNKFQEILYTKSIPTTAIANILHNNEINVGMGQLYKHRAKMCRCFRVVVR